MSIDQKRELTRERRAIILNRLRRLDAMLYPADDAVPAPRGERRARTKAVYFLALDEYFARLPRVVMSVCPFTGQPLERAFDPYGLDGPWWHKEVLSKVDEPPAPRAFKTLLGALHLGDRVPREAVEEVIPGPEAPFVVPRLLDLPGMVAVIGELRVQTGDVAYPVAYFSDQDIPPEKLHQFWLRQDFWYESEGGESSWLIANNPWDFDLKPWVDRKKVLWMADQNGKRVALSSDSGAACPYLNRPGERRPQILAAGERDLGDLPSGIPFSPFES